MDDGADPHPATGAPRSRSGSRAAQRRLRAPQSRMARVADGAGPHPATGAPPQRGGAHSTQIGLLPGCGRLSDEYVSQHVRWLLQHERVERARARLLERDSSRGCGMHCRSRYCSPASVSAVEAQDASELPVSAMDLPTFDALSMSDTLNTTPVTLEKPITDSESKRSTSALQVFDNFEWVLDTRAWEHHTSNMQLLEDLHEVGCGSLRSDTLSVPNIRYVDEDRRNVISVAQLAMKHGLVTVFEPRSCFVNDKDTGKIVGKGHICNGVYVLNYLCIHQDGRERQGGRGGGGREQGTVVEEEIVKFAGKEEESTSQISGTMELTTASGLWTEKDHWVLDMSATFHFTSNPELLSELMTHDVQEVAGVPVLGHGTIQTTTFSVPDVKYIQGKYSNVISVKQLSNLHGLECVFFPNCCLVRDPNCCLVGDRESEENIIGRGHLHKGKYVLESLKIGQHKVGEAGFMGIREQGPQDGGLRGIEARISAQEGGGCKGGGDGGGKSHNHHSGGGVEGHVGGEEGGEWHAGGGGEGNGNQTAEAAVEEGTTSVQATTQAVGLALASSGASQTSDERPKYFYVDSGAGYHVAWNGDVLHQYHDSLGICAPIQTISTVTGGAPVPVVGIGFIDGAGGRLDYVLFVPSFVVNLVSVSQLSEEYNVRVSFYKDKVWIDKIEDGTRVGWGYLMGKHYVLDHLHAGNLVSMSLSGP